MADSYVQTFLRRFRDMTVSPPPAPWRTIGPFAVGGMRSIGFAEGTEMLLVTSSSGRGLFNCRTGERLARDERECGSWEDEVALMEEGIGPLSGKFVRMAGLHGGGMPVFTVDGWGVRVVAPDWPSAGVILCPPGKSVWAPKESERLGCVKICEVEEARAVGFSDSGISLAVADSSHTLHLFGRNV
jgi:hypothetical protein